MALTTTAGTVNENGQEVIGPTGQAGSDHLQQIYVLRCQRCGHEYGANGSDVWQRRCPACGAGAPGFPVTAADVIESSTPSRNRNPNWTRDELILALDVYFDVPSPDQNHPVVAELSAVLNQLWAARDHGGGETLRNPSGVSMKLSNFQRFDPRYQERGRKGLAHGNHLEEEVWNDFAGDHQRLKHVAATIRAVLATSPEIAADAIGANEDEDAPEGAIVSRLHISRERNSKIVRKRKESTRAKHGFLACEACGFDFGEAYGPRGDGYIEAHHTKPVHTLSVGDRTKPSDLALICANCHRMIHARREWLTVDELRAILQRQAAAGR